MKHLVTEAMGRPRRRRRSNDLAGLAIQQGESDVGAASGRFSHRGLAGARTLNPPIGPRAALRHHRRCGTSCGPGPRVTAQA